MSLEDRDKLACALIKQNNISLCQELVSIIMRQQQREHVTTRKHDIATNISLKKKIR